MSFSFFHYFLLSLLATIASVAYCSYTYHTFYAGAIYITSNKLLICVLSNMVFAMVISLGKGVKRVFLGTLTRDEVEDLIQNSKYAITETCLALTIFREELNFKLLSLFFCLLFFKIFHWLVSMRIEYFARSHGIGRGAHIRLLALFAFLFVVDAMFVAIISLQLLQQKTASVLLLFGFEYLILLVFLGGSFMKYLISIVDAYYDGRWAAKSVFIFYLEFLCDLVRLCLYLIFFCIICTYYGLPLHLIRELCVTFYHLKERIVKFIQFRKITKNMKEKFPDVTAAELEQGDKTCIVCREDMDVTVCCKKLPCSHMFHFACLRTWLERSNHCPTCRADLSLSAPANAPNAAANNAAAAAAVNNAANPQAPAAAAAAPPAFTLPPLPSSLQLPPSLHQQFEALRATSQTLAHGSDASSLPPLPTAAHNAHLSPPHFTPHAAALPPFTPPTPQQFGLSPAALNAFLPHAPMFAPGLQAPLFPPGLSAPLVPPFSPSLFDGAITAPFDAHHASLLSHQTMLLQHHIEFLQSSLQQAQTLMEKQRKMEIRVKEEIEKRESEDKLNEKKEAERAPDDDSIRQRKIKQHNSDDLSSPTYY